MSYMKCEICGNDTFRWTDVHGIAGCISCNAPHRVYHYEGGKRVNKPIECIVDDCWKPILRDFYEKNHRLIPNGLCFLGSTYQPCSEEDYNEWEKYCYDLESRGELPVIREPEE